MTTTVIASSRTGTSLIEIHSGHKRDRPEILRLLKQARIGTDTNVPIENYSLVRIDGQLVAVGAIDFPRPGVAILTRLAVRKDMRHRGIGAALITHRLNQARARGARLVALVTMYYHFNLYKRRGFRTCPRQDLPAELRDYWMFREPRYMKCAVMWRHL